MATIDSLQQKKYQP